MTAPGHPERPYAGFMASAARNPDAVALEIGDQQWRYGELAEQAQRWVAALRALLGTQAAGQRVGVLASRSLTAYLGSMAVLGSGAALVALNPAYPVARNLVILQRAGVQTLLVGAEGAAMLAALAAASPRPLRVICPVLPRSAAPAGVSQWLDAADLAAQTPAVAPFAQPAAQDLAYIVFTSGSTGEPKGVAIAHGQLCAYMHNYLRLAPTQAEDRVATTYELSFDVALHDLLHTWWAGATLVVMPERAMLAPARFILDRQITVWFSVASFAMLMQRQGVLRPGLFPMLRLSLLCGEALPVATAAAWSQAAPGSALYNVWGPTETTMELAFYRWDPAQSPVHSLRGLVPIGQPFADHRHLLLDEQGQVVVGPGTGELWVSGPQLGLGYWGDEARTEASFCSLPGQTGRWYRSGDRVERDALGDYHFISRVDAMVKVRGHRIELGEVEHALRRASGVDLVAVLPKPAADGLAHGLVGVLGAAPGASLAAVQAALQQLLPRAMWPDTLQVHTAWPLNANRKLDRAALAARVLGG
jgi:amino acid adenylation domain-containing protein